MGFMAGKRALIVGVASDRSIATGIAEAFAREGAEIAFTYQNEKLKGRVEKLSARLGQNTDLLYQCDVTSDEEIAAVFENLGKEWDKLDIIVHSVGFAPREQLEGGFTESITREGYAISHDISAYSLAALAKAAVPMLSDNSAILALTYNAAVQVVPNYNVMGLAKASLESCVRFLASDLGPKGVRVNAISAGAIKTLAAAGISGLRSRKSVTRLRSCARILLVASRARRRLSTPASILWGWCLTTIEIVDLPLRNIEHRFAIEIRLVPLGGPVQRSIQ
jgi:enoyl-[acyl-carrier protein] reductase I